MIRWQMSEGGVDQRHTVWLDQARNLALRKYTEEFQPPGQKWIRTQSSEATEMGMTSFQDASGKKVEYHYPKIVLSEVFNSDDNRKTFDQRCEFIDVRINPPIANNLFTLTIEPGTTVFDLDTGRTFTHGRVPAEKLKKDVDQRIKEAEQQAESINSLGEPGIQTPPASLASRVAWVALALGVAGMAVALFLKVRGFRTL